MAKFCQNCDTELESGAKFCPGCGNAVISQTTDAELKGDTPSQGGRVGFSDKINDPKIIESMEKSKKAGRDCIYILIPLPLIIYLIVSFVSDEVELKDALIIGGAISVIFLLFNLFTSFLSNAKRSWDGVVVNKRYRERTRRYKDGNIEHYDEYEIIFRTDSGKKERCVERDHHGRCDVYYYDYLEIGDRVRYFPQLNFSYEKYDKSRDSEIPCMMCKEFNDIHNDICDKCGNPLFK